MCDIITSNKYSNILVEERTKDIMKIDNLVYKKALDIAIKIEKELSDNENIPYSQIEKLQDIISKLREKIW